MSYRNLSFAVCVCLAASFLAFGQANQGTGYLFQYAGYPSSSGQFLGYVATGNLNVSINTTGIAGLSQIIAKPDGSKFYLIGSGATTTSIQSADSSFTIFKSINGFGSTPTSATISPDGKYLLVAADAFYMIDTSSDSIVATLPMDGSTVYGSDETGYCVSCWIAVSHDSTTAYVLTNSSFGSQLNTYNLSTKTRGASVSGLTGDATSVQISPLGLIYVTAANRIFVIDPKTLTVTANGALALFDFEPYALRFTPDGTTAYAANRIPSLAGESMMQLNLATNAWSYWPARGTSGAPSFDDVFVASNNRVFAYSSALTTVYDVTANPLSAVESISLGLSQATVEHVQAIAITNEAPTAKYLFLLVSNGNQTNLYREDLVTSSNSTSGLAGSGTGKMQYVVVPPESGAANFITFNALQNLNPGTTGVTSQALLARITNTNGQPVYNLPVTFSADPTATGITINTPTPTTNADGYVQTTVTVASGATCPSSSCAITLTAGSATTTFTINLPVTGGGGGGGGSTSSQVTIISGDGQLLQDNFSQAAVADPLTVLVTDTNGKPLSGVEVDFALTVGSTVSIYSPSGVTDQNGLASSSVIGESLPPGDPLETNIVTATTPYGSANFSEIVFHKDPQGIGPQITLLAPSPSRGFTITMPEGSTLPNAIVAQVFTNPSSASPTPTPIPGYTVFTQNTADPVGTPPAAMCQGATNADATGTSKCTLVAACQTGNFGLTIQVGNYQNFDGQISITGGAASKLAITSGNNQSGVAGQLLFPLIATVTDGCNNAISGAAVTWTITQGSATLSNTVNTSNASGQVKTSVTLGQTPGQITVRLSSTGLPSVNFTLTNTVVVAGIALQSGTGQTAVAGAAFAQPLVFQVKDNTGKPLSGISVTFAVATGSATLNPATATSDAQGLASTTVTAGSVPGAVSVTASAAGFTASANLTVQAPGPTITSASFFNAASFQPGLVPCGLGTVIGNGIAPTVTGVIAGSSGFGPLPYTLGGLSMTIGGVPVPLYSISNQNGKQQATFQTPCETAVGTTTAVVTVNGGTPSTITGVPVAPAQPGIFTYAGPNNIQYGAVIRAVDGSYVTPSNLAHRGETYYLVATGLGQTTPSIVTNSTTITTESVNAQIIVGVNNAGVPVTSAQYLAGSIGVYIVGFQIPADAPTGTNVPLAIAAIPNTGTPQVIYGNPVFLPGVQ